METGQDKRHSTPEQRRTDANNLDLGHVDNENNVSPVQYDNIDYDALRNADPSQDQHTYRGLVFGSHETSRKQTTIRGDKTEMPKRTTEHKQKGRRVFLLIIVFLVVILVAMTSTFGVFYAGVFDKDESSGAQHHGTEKASLFTTTSIDTALTTTTSAATSTSGAPSIDERCENYNGTIPHAVECQAYHNCNGARFLNYPNNLNEPYLRECPYPQLFNTEIMACDHFENVNCGERREPSHQCGYRANRCSISHCIPCRYAYVYSCAGKKDGINMINDKPWTSSYIICYKERFVTTMSCPEDPKYSRSQLFSPEYNACLPLDRVPKEHGGYMPSCKGKKDGLNMDDDRPWSPYYMICIKETFVTMLQCPSDRVSSQVLYFSPQYNGCVSLDQIPQQYGGHRPNCTGNADGRHSNENGNCNTYRICAFGRYSGFETCRNGTAFDGVTETCTLSPYICKCGNSC